MARLHTYSRYLPQPLREVLRERILLPLAVRGVRQAAAPSRGLLACLRLGWGNLGWTPALPFLESVWRHAQQTQGPILECGSGLTTLLLRLRESPERHLLSLEHEESSHAKIAKALDRWGLSSAGVRLVPLRDYGGFTWYDLANVPLPDSIRLVLCDGPPRTTPGGRYGLLPLLAPKMAPGCVVLMDDADDEEVCATLRRWVDEFHGRSEDAGRDSGVAIYVHR